MDPTQNLFWNYMLFKMRGFLRKIISMEFSEIKKGGFPADKFGKTGNESSRIAIVSGHETVV